MHQRIIIFSIVFFVMAGIHFLPAQDNKYLQYQRVMLVDNDSVKCRELIKYASYLADSLRDYDFAILVYKKVDLILAKNNYDYLKLRLWYNWGYACYLKGSFRDADRLYTKVLESSLLSAQPEFKAKVLNNAGVNLYNLKVLKRAMSYYNQALELYIKTQNPKGIGSVYWNMVNLFTMSGDLAQANAMLQKATKIFIDNDLLEDYNSVLISKAHIKSKGKQFDSAIIFYHRALSLPLKKQLKQPVLYLSSYIYLGRNYADVEKWDSAFYFLNMAKRLSDSLQLGYRLNSVYYFSMGYSYDYKGDLKKALSYYNRALQEKNDIVNRRFLYENMADIYLQLKQYDSVLLYKDKAIRFADSLYASELKEHIAFENKRIELLQSNYNARINEAMQKQAVEQLEKKNYLLLGATLLLALGLLLFLVYFRQYRLKIKKEHLQGELDFLKAQLNPHFLFNSINNIYVLLDEDKNRASGALLKFSELMRYQLYECNVPAVSLDKELRFLENYIGFEQLRYSNKIIVQAELSAPGGNLAIAPLLLQPFIENAFKHTPKRKDEKSMITISAALSGNEFLFEVINTVNEETISQLPGGIGLENVKKRLKLLYPGRHDLKITKTNKQYTVALKLTLAHD